ncbi:MAG: double zinc ribbon domain-containing protein [Culturomica sp.]|jgi:ComF family protein|nr:double zinc ribbon domain-containing protein [Culturomica sp.]
MSWKYTGWFRGLLRLFYPPSCAVCETPLVRGERFICTHCLSEFPYAESAFSVELEHSSPECRVLFHYNKQSRYRKLVYAVKYRSGKELGYYLGGLLGRRLKNTEEIDAVVPVPLHPRKERKRGYNQSKQIAAGLAEALGKPLWDDVAVKIRNNPSQTGKNATDRRKNVENAFRLCRPERIRGCRLLVVDDIITTGATLSSFLQTLSEAGGVHFTVACLGRTEL